MTQFSLEIKNHNVKPHLDVEAEMQKQKEGLFTFTLRINNGNIVDCAITEYVTASRYKLVKEIVVEELIISRDHGERSESDTIRDDNL